MLLAAFIFVKAIHKEVRGDCPSCGNIIHIEQEFLATLNEKLVLCRNRYTYFKVEGDMLWHISKDYVSESPVFRIRLNFKAILPKECCVCGAEPTRYELSKVERYEFPSVLPFPPPPIAATMDMVQIPYYEKDECGAKLVGNFLKTFIEFRSYSYFRKFYQINKLFLAETQDQ